MTTCPCACHGGPGAYPPPCDQPGGCGPHEADQPTCAAVGCRRAPDPVICRHHADDLGKWLAAIDPDSLADVSAAPSMQGREPGTGGSGGGLKSERSVGDLRVMALRDPRTAADDNLLSVFAVLHEWAEQVREGREIVTHPTRAMARMPGYHGPLCDHWCRHASCIAGTWRYWRAFRPTIATERKLLAAQLETWILLQDWAGTFCDEIRELWILLDRAVHGARPQVAKRACPLCGGLVTVQAGVAACTGCDGTWHGLDIARLGAAA